MGLGSRMFARKAAATAVLALFASVASAQQFTIKDIRVEGVQRTEAGTVFSYLPLRVGDRYDPERGIQAIRALYASGLFKDVRLEIDDDVLVVVVEERPAIASVDISGVTEFDKDLVKKSLRDVGLADGRIFDRSVLERADQELRRQYLSKGLYGVQVKSTVTPIERNRVKIAINVEEGEIAKIESIRFVGNKVFTESDLRGQMELGTPNWLSWYTKRDQYSRQKLAGDLEKVRSYYLNRGYLDFKIDSVQVSISPDKQQIYITVNLTEGDKYTISSVKLTGDMLGLESDFAKLITVVPGEVYNAEKLNAIAKAITDRLSTLGYAFATATPSPDPDRANDSVVVNIVVDPGRRVYVRKVNVSGNTRTRDEVIRREVRQYESAWLDSDAVKISRDRIDRTGFFEEVKIDTPPVPTAPDQVDVNVTVKERPTGNIQLGAGYSSSDGIVLNAGLQQTNLFGSGNALSFEVNTSKVNSVYAITYTNPYITPEGISRTIEIFDRSSDLAELGLADVSFSTRGAGLSFGVPFTEYDRVFFGLRFDANSIDLTPYSPLRYREFVNEFGDRPNALAATIGWARDNRDNILVPTRGNYQRVTGEVGLPGFDLTYYRASYQYQQFWPVTQRLTLAFNGELGYGDGYSNQPYPFFKNFYVGGIGSVRGFEAASLGPRDLQGDPMGGTRRINYSFELLTPMPGADRTLRIFTFLDSGWVWGQTPYVENNTIKYRNDSISLGDLRYSVGIGIAWISPLGPLKLSYAFPINDKPGDRLQAFQFQIGTGF